MCLEFPHRLQQIPFLPVEVLQTPDHPTRPRELGIVRPPLHPENQRPPPPCSRRPCRGSTRQQQPSRACSGCEDRRRCYCSEKGDSGSGLSWSASGPWCWRWWRHWWDESRCWRRVIHGGRGAWDKCLRCATIHVPCAPPTGMNAPQQRLDRLDEQRIGDGLVRSTWTSHRTPPVAQGLERCWYVPGFGKECRGLCLIYSILDATAISGWCTDVCSPDTLVLCTAHMFLPAVQQASGMRLDIRKR